MCRILYLKGKNKNKALEYIDAFYNAGFNDPHLSGRLQKENKNSHIHGWGYLLVTPENIETYLNAEAFCEDRKGFDSLKNKIQNLTGEFMLMAEFRLTDSGYVSALNSHPFNFSSRNGYEGIFFYNGVFDYKKLAKIENINFDCYKNKNSTVLLGHSFSRILEQTNDIYKAIEYPKIAQKTGYNLMMFVNDNSGIYKSIIHSYANPCLLETDEGYKKYITLIKKDEKDLFFVGSNAISCYKSGDYEIMENGETLSFEIDFIKEFIIEDNNYKL